MVRFFSLLIPLLIGWYLYALWSEWFTEAEVNDIQKRPLYSQELDLRKPGKIVWDIAPERLGFAEGKAKLSLALNLNALLEKPEQREAVMLRVKVVAQGRQPNKEWENRLIQDWYFKTDEPFSPAGEGLWETYGYGRLEFGLAGVDVVPGEEVRITLMVQVPDGLLMSGYPRLKLMFGSSINYAPFMRFARRNLGFFLSLAGLVWLSFRAWRSQPWKKGEAMIKDNQGPGVSGAGQPSIPV